MTTVWIFISAAAEWLLVLVLVLGALVGYPAGALCAADKRPAELLSDEAELLRGNRAPEGLRGIEIPKGLGELLRGGNETKGVALELLGAAGTFSEAIRRPGEEDLLVFEDIRGERERVTDDLRVFPLQKSKWPQGIFRLLPGTVLLSGVCRISLSVDLLVRVLISIDQQADAINPEPLINEVSHIDHLSAGYFPPGVPR